MDKIYQLHALSASGRAIFYGGFIMAKHQFDNAAECQKYLHKLMAAVDRHNQSR